jgi:uncharacterized repeat protein (TIGR01451 family)
MRKIIAIGIVLVMILMGLMVISPTSTAETEFVETSWQKTTTADTLYESFDQITNWDILPGNHNWHVSGGVMIQDAYQYIPGSRIITGDSGWTDYTAQVKVKVEGSGPWRYGGILLRASDDAQNYYEIYLQEGGWLQFTKAINGIRTWPMGVSNMHVPVGNYYNQWWYVKGQVIGNIVRGKAWQVGTSEPGWHYTWTDSTSPLTSGKVGLITFSKPGCDRVSFDDMYVAAPLGQSLYPANSDYWSWTNDAWDGPATNGYGGSLPYVPEDDEWAYWPHISPSGCGGGWFTHYWFKTTLYIDDINAISSVLLLGKYIPNNRIMINDNMYVYVNGEAQTYGGVMYSESNPTLDWAIAPQAGWSINPLTIPVSSLNIGNNEIMILAEESCGWGGLGNIGFLISYETPTMSVVKSAEDVVAPGDSIQYLISYENTGSVTAYNVIITDIFPSEYFTSVSATPTWDSKVDDVYTWDIGALATGNSGTIEVTATVKTTFEGLITDTITLDYKDSLGYSRPTETSQANTVVSPDYCNMHTTGFWKHQVNALIRGKGNPEYTISEMNAFATTISNKGTALGTFSSYEDMLDYLVTPRGKTCKNPTELMKMRALHEYMALWLNIVSYRTSLGTEIILTDSLDKLSIEDFWIEGTVNDAITEIETILDNELSTFDDYDKAKTIAWYLNEGYGKVTREDKSVLIIYTQYRFWASGVYRYPTTDMYTTNIMKNWLTTDGYNVATADYEDLISTYTTTETLRDYIDDYDVVIVDTLSFPFQPYSYDSGRFIYALQQYFESGGGIILAGDDNSYAYNNGIIQDTLEDLTLLDHTNNGLNYVTYTVTFSGTSHPVIHDLGGTSFDYDLDIDVTTPLTGAEVLATTHQNKPALAVNDGTDSGKGRIVTLLFALEGDPDSAWETWYPSMDLGVTTPLTVGQPLLDNSVLWTSNIT